MSELAALAASGRVEEHVPLAALTTYKFGGPARWFGTAASAADVAELVGAAHAAGTEVLMIGRGSNLVVSDAGYPGLAIKLAGELASIDIKADGTVIAGAAVSLPMLARACARAGRGGLEFLVAVPGSVGGAVRMNAGCHGSETGEWLTAAEVHRPGIGTITVNRDEMEMTYRHNTLPPDDIVLRATFRTQARSAAEGEAIMREITQWRRRHQPGGTFNAGSVFKNPPGDAAGRLIDSLGLKGFAVGGARVSPRHANFFEATPDAAAQDVYDLVRVVAAIVAERTGVELQPEIRFAGPFEINDIAEVMAEHAGPAAEGGSR